MVRSQSRFPRLYSMEHIRWKSTWKQVSRCFPKIVFAYRPNSKWKTFHLRLVTRKLHQRSWRRQATPSQSQTWVKAQITNTCTSLLVLIWLTTRTKLSDNPNKSTLLSKRQTWGRTNNCRSMHRLSGTQRREFLRVESIFQANLIWLMANTK